MKISKAIIPVAGWGTRRLPITKAIEKCMLPIGNRPIVDYVVEDCIKAGITEIYFVVGEQSEQLRQYYSKHVALDDYLTTHGKTEALKLATPPENITFHYIVQPKGKYGTAIPVALAAEHLVPDESVVVLMGDDFIYNADGASEVARLLDSAGEEASLLGVEVPHEDVSKYGVLQVSAESEFQGIVEKPSAEDAPSNLINISKYVMTPGLLREIMAYMLRDDVKGEYLITEPINAYMAKGEVVKVVPAQGRYLDGGTLEGWLEANRVVCGGQ